MIEDPLIGAQIGSYVVERKIGAGGMGAVYELVHPGIGKRLALKTLHAELSAREDIVKRFFDEARAVNVIGHPNIVDIIDFNKLEDGRFYLTMEYLEGDSLSDYLERRAPLPPEEVAAIALPICSALGAAHEAGITHRDLKPENVHLVQRASAPREVKVLDFGIAKLSGDATPSQRTRSGIVLGTPAYMSPEQANGRGNEVDHRTDVYALGVILYEMLSGRRPFTGESFATYIIKHSQEPPAPLSEVAPAVPPAWDPLVLTALAKPREERFQSMAEMAAAIETALADPAPVPQTARRHTAAKEPDRRRMLVPVILGLVLAVTTAAVLLILHGGSGPAAKGGSDAGASAADAALAKGIKFDARPAAGPPDASLASSASIDAAAPAPDAAPKRRPPRGRGRLRVTAVPWGEVYIDGKKRGVTPLTITLAAGSHRVVVKNPELGERASRRVRVRRGQLSRVKLRFER